MGVQADGLPAFLRRLFTLTNIRGALVTMPHKVTTVGLVDEVTPAARSPARATRCDARGRPLLGDMFDGEGFVRGVRRKGSRCAGASALVVGGGGVGSAIAASLAAAGVGAMALYDARGRRGRCARRAGCAAHYPGARVHRVNDPAGYDIVVNATPLGMNDRRSAADGRRA